MMTPRLAWMVVVSFGLASCVPTTRSQAQAPATGDSLAAIDADYLKALDQLERTRIERLARLAELAPPAEAQQAYIALFQSALSGGHYIHAEPVAEKLVTSGKASGIVLYLAELTNLLAECDRGAFEDTLKSVERAMQLARQEAATGEELRVILPVDTRLSIVETYYQKLVQAGQFDVAMRAFRLLSEKAATPAVKAYAAGRLARLEMIDKPAPALAGEDTEGKPFDLASLKGKVVLVEFWASWCLPSGPEADMLLHVYQANREKGLVVVGVNLDAMQDGTDEAEIRDDVRRFLVEHNVTFPNLVNGPGERDHARAFGVTDIPANFLIGRDGRIENVDLAATNIDAAVGKALGRAAK